MKIAVLIEDHYQVLEVWYPYLRLREEGMDTVFVGPGRKKGIRQQRGLSCAGRNFSKESQDG